MADDILKSYLVSIGFKVDEQDYKKFKDSQLETEKRTKDLSKAFSDFAKIGIGSATALGGMVLKVSPSLENLHFQAQKSGTSAQNLKAFGDAAAQIGIQSESAMGMVEKLNNQIRDNPMGEGAFLGFLGVDANQDKVKVLLDLVDSLAKIQGPNADVLRATYGSHFGFSGEDVRTLIRGREELNKYYEERKKVYGDIDAQSLAAHKANEEFRDLEARFAALTNAIGTTFLPIAKDVVSVLEVIVKDLIEADHATSGWSSKILGLGAAAVTAGGALKVLGVIKGIPGVGTGGIPGATVAGITGAGILGGALANWGINIAADTNDIKAQSDYDSVANSNRNEAAYIRMYKAETGKSPEENYLAYNAWKRQKMSGRKFGGFLNSPIPGNNSEFNNPGNLRSWGDTPTAERFRNGVSIGNFAKFGSASEGLSAMAGNLSAYGRRGVNSISDIIKQWAPSRENDTASYIKDVASRTGFGASAKLNMSDPETISTLMAAMIHHEQGKDPYSMAMISASANKRLMSDSAGGVRIDQRTEINVNGNSSPAATADLVAKQQDRINANMARNFTGATQ
jgi:hypothetical protein